MMDYVSGVGILMKTNKIGVDDGGRYGYFVCCRYTFIRPAIEGLYRRRKFRPHASPHKIKWRLREMWKNMDWKYNEV